jgi:tRNA(adenine34) deaminase
MAVWDDKAFMNVALEQAKLALEANEVPIGAVVVNPEGTIIGKGHNLVEHDHQQIAHAEVKAISQACQTRQDWRLDGCWIYVTLEPCAMCLNLILLSRISRVIFGARSPIFGYHLDNGGPIQVYRRNVLEVVGGIAEQEASTLLKQFFKEKRMKSDGR